jgi:multiple sugar transport system ATP-binding protein
VELKRIHAEPGATSLNVTHEQIEAMTMDTHVGGVDLGRRVQFGPPRARSEDPVGICVVRRLGQPRITLLLADSFGPGAPAGAVQMGLRPEQIVQGDGLPALVRRVERLGDQTRLHLTFGPHEIITPTPTPRLRRMTASSSGRRVRFGLTRKGNRIGGPVA